ncbi:MAG: hypothetical protein AB1815_05410 [Bacillota bacterium]
MFDAYTVLFSLLIIGVYGFAIYFVITAITFMREKNNHTKKMILKLDELIKLNKERLL